MRPSRRSLPYTASTVLGLAAPALAAVLLTSTAPGLAAVAPTPVLPAAEAELAPHAIGPVGALAPVVRPVARPAVRTVRPVVHAQRAVTRPAARPAAKRTVVRTAPHRVTKPKPKPSQTAQPWGADDYPYRNQSNYYAVDKWGFTQRQCVSFAAWRLAQHGHAVDNNKNNWGSAYTWDDTARRLGFTVTRTARVGSIAQWNAHESGAYYAKGSSRPNGSFAAGGYGHVGYVKQVYSDGSALVEQYNMSGSRSYSVMRVRAPRYLVIR